MSSVDVIVPCYRYGRFLETCVNSILSQQSSTVRVLILDDASPDNTEEVGKDLARRDSRVTFVRHAINKGHIATYNEGIDWVSSDYMLLLSADDYLLPDALNRSTQLMHRRPEVGFTFGNVYELDECGLRKQATGLLASLFEADHRILTGKEFIELSGALNIVPTPTAVVRTALQKRVGWYKPQLPHAGDMEMWFRLAARASVGVFGAYQAVYRRHSRNMSLDYADASNKRRLPDLEQRKIAFDCFLEDSGAMLPDANALHQRMLWLLACEALNCASAAYNDADLAFSEQLSAFALRICPKVSLSWPSAKLAAKRKLGPTGWGSVQRILAGMRKIGSSGEHRTGAE